MFLGIALDEKGEHALAQREFEKIPEKHEDRADARVHIAISLSKERKLAEAEAALEKLLATHPKTVSAYELLASFREQRRELREAEQVYKNGLAVMPVEPRLLYGLGVLCEKQGDSDRAIEWMKRLLRIDPEHAEALNFVGYAYAERGSNLDEAERMVKLALQIRPASGYITDSLGWIYFKQGKNQLALATLLEAFRLAPREAAIAGHLADVYEELEDRVRAIEMYHKALLLKPDAKTRAMLERKLSRIRKEAERTPRR